MSTLYLMACSAAHVLGDPPAAHALHSGVRKAAVVAFTLPPSDQNPTLHLSHVRPPKPG